ncbi:hypothetical protein ACOMHN_005150 [Nucella lapillus]
MIHFSFQVTVFKCSRCSRHAGHDLCLCHCLQDCATVSRTVPLSPGLCHCLQDCAAVSSYLKFSTTIPSGTPPFSKDLLWQMELKAAD